MASSRQETRERASAVAIVATRSFAYGRSGAFSARGASSIGSGFVRAFTSGV